MTNDASHHTRPKRTSDGPHAANRSVGSLHSACSAARPNFKKCKCGNLIVLAHGEDECAVCYMKKRGLWEDPIEELKRKYGKPQNAGTQRRRDENAPPATETQSRRSLE